MTRETCVLHVPFSLAKVLLVGGTKVVEIHLVSVFFFFFFSSCWCLRSFKESNSLPKAGENDS